METSETSCPWRESSVVLRTSRAAEWVELSSCGAALPGLGCCSGGTFRAFLGCWVCGTPGRAACGDIIPIAGALPGFTCQGCGVVPAFEPLRKVRANSKYHQGIFSNSKVTSKNREGGEALGHLFAAKLFLSSEQAALPTFPPSIPREKPRWFSRLW